MILIQWDAHLGFNKELRGDVNNPILQQITVRLMKSKPIKAR